MDRIEKTLNELIRLLERKQKSKTSGSSSLDETQATQLPARITVQLPANAQLYVNNVRCPMTSATRSFQTPDLQFGKRYFYTLRMEAENSGQIVQQSRRVILSAGEHVRVNFNRPETVSTVQR